MPRLLLSAVVLLGLTAAPAAAQTTLQWKFKPGDFFYLENANKTDTRSEVMGQVIKESKTTTLVSKFTVTTATPEAFVLEQQIMQWKDETVGQPAGGPAEALDKATRGAKFTMTMSPQGKITRYEGYGAFMKRLEDEFAAEAALLKSILTEQALRSTVEMFFHVLPPAPVKMGDDWKHKLNVPAGFLGQFEYETKYVYEGNKDGLAVVKTNGTFTFQPPKEDIPGAPFKIVKLDLKSKGSQGTLKFDTEKGRLASLEFNLPMEGVMTMEVMGNEVTVNMAATEARTIRVLNRNPVKE